MHWRRIRGCRDGTRPRRCAPEPPAPCLRRSGPRAGAGPPAIPTATRSRPRWQRDWAACWIPCRAGEVLVSRGEAVEIGGGFRIPDVMRQSGARMVDVGTTNRTRAADYLTAITPRTRAIVRVHASNFSILGFTERPTTAECAAI